MKSNSNIRIIITALLAAAIMALLPAAGARADEDFTPKYSDDELYKIYDELIAEYMNDNDPDAVFAVTGIGVGGAMINGELTGFGESGLEKRVVVTVRYQYYEEYKKKIEDKYGDAVYVEYLESSKAEYESQNISFDDGTGNAADPAANAQTSDPARISEVESTHGTGTSAKAQIIVGVILAAAAAVAIYFYLKKNRKPAKKGKKK